MLAHTTSNKAEETICWFFCYFTKIFLGLISQQANMGTAKLFEVH